MTINEINAIIRSILPVTVTVGTKTVTVRVEEYSVLDSACNPSGWINTSININGEEHCFGGCWIRESGLELYRGYDNGELDELPLELGLVFDKDGSIDLDSCDDLINKLWIKYICEQAHAAVTTGLAASLDTFLVTG